MKSVLDLTRQLKMLGIVNAEFNAKAYPKVRVFLRGKSTSCFGWHYDE